MGRFFAIILMVAACGDNVVPASITSRPGAVANPAGLAPEVPRYAPEVCGVRMWSTVIAGDPASTVSVVARATGADVLAAPTAGGTLTGFAIDDRMDVMAGAAGTKLPITGTFTTVSASVVGARLVAAAADVDAIRIDLLDDNLANPVEVAKLPTGLIADPAFFIADGAQIVPIADATGLAVYEFDAAWQLTGTQRLATTDAATGFTAAQLGLATLAAWSTQTSCNLMKISAYGPAIATRIAVPCAAPRLAVDDALGTGVLVFEGDGNIRLMNISHTQMGGGSALVRPNATSPRVLFDGERYWVSYLDVRGDVSVGFVDGAGHVIAMSLDGPQPQQGAYELEMIDGAPWVLSLDATGYSGYRMCVTPA